MSLFLFNQITGECADSREKCHQLTGALAQGTNRRSKQWKTMVQHETEHLKMALIHNKKREKNYLSMAHCDAPGICLNVW